MIAEEKRFNGNHLLCRHKENILIPFSLSRKFVKIHLENSKNVTVYLQGGGGRNASDWSHGVSELAHDNIAKGTRVNKHSCYFLRIVPLLELTEKQEQMSP